MTLYSGSGEHDAKAGYYQISGNQLLKDGSTVTIPANRFFLSSTDDDAVRNSDAPNVIYRVADGYECNNAVLSLNGDSFYAPCNLTAKTLTVEGEMAMNNGGYSLTLPFAVEKGSFTDASGSATELTLCTYLEENGNRFTFQKMERVPANVPMYIISKAGKLKLAVGNNISIAGTPGEQIVEPGDEYTLENTSRSCYGTFRPVIAGEIGDRTNDNYTVWALKDGVFRAAKKGRFERAEDFEDMLGHGYANAAKFKPFRMVITTPKTMSVADDANPRYISLIDEFGDEISNTSGIDGVDARAAFTVEGGKGEIRISSSKDFGMVDIYDTTGCAVAAADVKAGETRVSFQTGVYIVAGQKVMVK